MRLTFRAVGMRVADRKVEGVTLRAGVGEEIMDHPKDLKTTRMDPQIISLDPLTSPMGPLEMSKSHILIKTCTVDFVLNPATRLRGAKWQKRLR